MKMKPEDWMIEIEAGLEYRRQMGREAAWNKLELDYLNDPNGDTCIGENLIFSMGDALLSALTVPNPEFLIKPTHPMGVDRAPIVESVDNALITKMKLSDSVEEAILNSYLFGRAILKIGYDSEFGWSPYYDIGTTDQPYGMTLTQFDKKGRRIENGSVEPGMPWVRSVSPHDIVVPWGCKNIDDAPWIAHRVIRLNEQIKADPKYKNKTRLEPSVSMEGFVESYGHVMGRERRESRERTKKSYTFQNRAIFNVLWEIHDKMSGMVFVICFDYDRYLRKTRDALQVCGLPFVSGTLIKHPRSFWTTPQAYYLGQIQNTQYDIAVQAEKQRRINNLKFLADQNVISEDELNKLISGDVGAIGLAKSGSRSLRDSVVAFPQGHPGNSMLESANNQRAARDAIGFSANQTGEYDTSSRRTAREAAIVEQGSQSRTSRRMNVVVDIYTETIRKINKIIFTYWKFPRHAMVGRKWVSFTGEELQGDYLYDVTLSTKRNLSLAQRRIEAMEKAFQLAQIPGADIEEIKQYLIDASADPAFPGMLGVKQQQPQGNQLQLPGGRERKENGGQ
ncbi:MAG: hypothetical protein ACTSYW_02595 [Candidatus Heimdallarchaeota archaeon]